MSLTPDELLTVDEVAALLRQPIGTLRYWRSVNRGPRSARYGKRVLYRHGDVIAWQEQALSATEKGGTL